MSYLGVLEKNGLDREATEWIDVRFLGVWTKKGWITLEFNIPFINGFDGEWW